MRRVTTTGEVTFTLSTPLRESALPNVTPSATVIVMGTSLLSSAVPMVTVIPSGAPVTLATVGATEALPVYAATLLVNIFSPVTVPSAAAGKAMLVAVSITPEYSSCWLMCRPLKSRAVDHDLPPSFVKPIPRFVPSNAPMRICRWSLVGSMR